MRSTLFAVTLPVNPCTGPGKRRWHMASRALAAMLFTLGALAANAAAPAKDAAPPPATDPSVQDMVDALKPKPDLGRARSLVPGQPAPPPVPSQLQLMVQFEFNSAKVSTTSADLLKKLASAMNAPELARSRFLIEGHTDAVGTAAYNQDLSERRAAAVKQILIGQGAVDTARLLTVGRGSTQLVDTADPKAAANRRVRVVSMAGEVAKAAEPPPAATQKDTSLRLAGRITRLQGEATVGRNRDGTGKDSPLHEDDPVNAGDIIRTGAGASVVVGMNDGAKVLVRPGTSVTIAESIASGPLGTLVQRVELLVGAIRFITGDIGRRNPDGVRLKTPTLTIGIRGTDIDLVHAPRTRSGAAGGSYVKVNTGAVALTGVDGSLVELAPGEQGFGALEVPKVRGGPAPPAARKGMVPAEVFAGQDNDAALLGEKR